MPKEEYNSWLAWQKAILAKLDDLDKGQYAFRDQLTELSNRLIETVGISGKNGKVGMLTERVDAIEAKIERICDMCVENESLIKDGVNLDRTKLLASGALGGGSLAGIVELIKLWVG